MNLNFSKGTVNISVAMTLMIVSIQTIFFIATCVMFNCAYNNQNTTLHGLITVIKNENNIAKNQQTGLNHIKAIQSNQSDNFPDKKSIIK